LLICAIIIIKILKRFELFSLNSRKGNFIFAFEFKKKNTFHVIYCTTCFIGARYHIRSLNAFLYNLSNLYIYIYIYYLIKVLKMLCIINLNINLSTTLQHILSINCINFLIYLDCSQNLVKHMTIFKSFDKRIYFFYDPLVLN